MTDTVAMATVCAACESPLSPVFRHDTAPTSFQFADALWVGFFGGYGMYVDEMSEMPGANVDKVLPGADFEAVLCKDCADRLVDANPWLRKVMSAPA